RIFGIRRRGRARRGARSRSRERDRSDVGGGLRNRQCLVRLRGAAPIEWARAVCPPLRCLRGRRGRLRLILIRRRDETEVGAERRRPVSELAASAASRNTPRRTPLLL